MGPQRAWEGAGTGSDGDAPSSPIGPFSPRVAFLTTLTLAPLYAVVDAAQRLAPGPDTAFSGFYALPAFVHLLAFVGIYALVWLLWYAALRLSGADRRADHPLARASAVESLRPLLLVYLLLVPAVALVAILARAFSLGLGVQALLLTSTCAYALRADRPHP